MKSSKVDRPSEAFNRKRRQPECPGSKWMYSISLIVYQLQEKQPDRHRATDYTKRSGREPQATNTGWTPLHVVCFYYKNENLIEIVRLLIQHGAEVNAKKVDGKTPLHLVCQYYKNSNLMDLVHLLIENGADSNVAQSLLG